MTLKIPCLNRFRETCNVETSHICFLMDKSESGSANATQTDERMKGLYYSVDGSRGEAKEIDVATCFSY